MLHAGGLLLETNLDSVVEVSVEDRLVEQVLACIDHVLEERVLEHCREVKQHAHFDHLECWPADLVGKPELVVALQGCAPGT